MLSLLAAVAVQGAPHTGPPILRELIATKPGRWLQHPVTIKSLHGKVVLLDFWDYSRNNCIRTFPYLREWYRRYHAKGFEIIGIHTPEFEFEHDPVNVKAAIKRFGFPWPELNDPQRENWTLYGVFGWATGIILNGLGHDVFFRVGEGSYGEVEQHIQKQLLVLHPGIKLPPVMAPIRATDKPGAVCLPMTPEIYTWIKGFPRNQLGYSPSEIGSTAIFSYPAKPVDGVVYLKGSWSPMKHHLDSASAGASLELRYMAKEVNAVLVPSRPVKVSVYEDGKAAPKSDLGDDVKMAGGIPTFIAQAPRMYSLLKNRTWQHRTLELRVQGSGLEIYSFSFSTDCNTVPARPGSKGPVASGRAGNRRARH